MTLLEQYLRLPHRHFYKEIDVASLVSSIQRTLSERNLKDQWVYLYQPDPIAFVISFLSILDLGGRPICLSQYKNLQMDSWGFVEGQWMGLSEPRTSERSGLQYAVPTSGTTGKPKLCEFDFETAKQNAVAHAKAFGLDSTLEIIQCLPVSHSYGIIAYILTPLVAGCSINFCPGTIGLRSLKKDLSPRPAMMHMSPSQARFVIRDKISVTHLKKVSVGGGPISLAELESLQAVLTLCEIYVSYGLTEAGPRVTTGRFFSGMASQLQVDPKSDWIGEAIDRVEIKLIEKAPAGAGRLCIRTPYAMVNSERLEKEGDWLITRDRVEIHQGHVLFLSREDDLLKYGGVTIYPKDIESVVRQWTGVSDAIILRENDPMYGDVPLLLIEGDIDLSIVNAWLERDIASFTAFKKIFVLKKFPRQSLDKVDRAQLLALARSQNL